MARPVVTGLIVAAVRIALWAALAAMVFVSFVWPFVLSRSPDQPVLHSFAVGTLLVFLVSILVLLCKGHRT